jgi:hypothetical protein
MGDSKSIASLAARQSTHMGIPLGLTPRAVPPRSPWEKAAPGA